MPSCSTDSSLLRVAKSLGEALGCEWPGDVAPRNVLEPKILDREMVGAYRDGIITHDELGDWVLAHLSTFLRLQFGVEESACAGGDELRKRAADAACEVYPDWYTERPQNLVPLQLSKIEKATL